MIAAHLTTATVHHPTASYTMVTLSVLAPTPPPGYTALVVQWTRAWGWN